MTAPNPTMTPDELREAMKHLDLATRDQLAAFLQVSLSTVRDWLGGRSPIPYPVALLLWTMMDRGESPALIECVALARGSSF